MSNIQEKLDKQLLNACRYGHVTEVDILLDKGANIHYSDDDDPFGATCLSEASRRGKSSIVSLLLTRGVSVNDKISHDITALHLCCERGHIDVVNVLLNNNAHPCPAELFNLDTPLHFAAANDHAEICKILVNNGNVNVNIRNRTGDTPLHIAVANDRLNSTTMLLNLGGDLNSKNHAEMTPIIVAQLAKCKHSIKAMQPFIDKFKLKQQNIQKLKKDKLTKSRKNTIKQTLNNPLSLNQNDLTLNDPILYENDLKYDSDYGSGDDNDNDGYLKKASSGGNIHSILSGKRNVVFKKGFLLKQGKKFKHFHERYFILWSNGVMNYYTKEHTLFANYTEKAKTQSPKNININAAVSLSPSGTNASLSNSSGNNSPIKSSTLLCDDNINTMANVNDIDNLMYNSADPDDNDNGNNVKGKKHNKMHRTRKSTLHKLGLKSDTIKPKGTIDINDLIETQFLEFSDNKPGWALITNLREWKFKCKNDRERREWIAAVHAVNYGISPFDFKHLDYNISYKDNTMLLTPSTNTFITNKNQNIDVTIINAVAQGWMYKLGAAVRGLEQNYWKKRWVSLYKKPARLAYAMHPYHNINKDHNKNLKGVIQLNDVTNIIKVGNNMIIKNKYRAPTVHVFALITDKRTWVFACKTAEECNMWHDRISFFLPDQWKNKNQNTSNNVDFEELLRFNRVKTIANENDNGSDDDQNDNNLNVNKNKKKNGSKLNKKKKNKKKNKGLTDDTMMSKILRKVSTVAETLGITEQYSTISGVQPKGTITATDYDDAINMVNGNTDNNNIV